MEFKIGQVLVETEARASDRLWVVTNIQDDIWIKLDCNGVTTSLFYTDLKTALGKQNARGTSWREATPEETKTALLNKIAALAEERRKIEELGKSLMFSGVFTPGEISEIKF